LDFRRGEILIDVSPYTLRSGDLLLGGVSIMPENAKTSVLVKSMHDLLVQRNPQKSAELITKLERLYKKKHEDIRLKNVDKLTREMTPDFLTAPRKSPYAATDYGMNPCGEDLFSRWITQLPRTDWMLSGHGSSQMMADDNIECNVCKALFKPPFSSFIFTDSYDEFQESNKKLLAKRGDKLYCSIDKHGENHIDSIPHTYNCKPLMPTKVWPWELLASNVAQQILWDSYIFAGGINLRLLEDAYIKKDDKQLTAQLSMICGMAIAGCHHNPDKYMKRLKGCGICIPTDSRWESLKSLRGRKNQAMKSFMRYTELSILTEIQRLLVRFDYVSFIHTFGTDPNISDDRVKVGYAWNAVCLFFSHGLDTGVFFPPTKSLHFKNVSFFDSYISENSN
jgi:hypothetical protein